MTDDIVERLRSSLSQRKRWPRDRLEAADEIDRLRAALRDIREVYAGSEGIPEPMTAAEGYLLRLLMEMTGIASSALGEEKTNDAAA